MHISAQAPEMPSLALWLARSRFSVKFVTLSFNEHCTQYIDFVDCFYSSLNISSRRVRACLLLRESCLQTIVLVWTVLSSSRRAW